MKFNNRNVHISPKARLGANVRIGDNTVIYDNVETPKTIELLTPTQGAHVLITSRWTEWFGIARGLPVDVFPRDIAIARSVGLGLDEKAIETVKTWKFDPAMKDGKPVAVQIIVEVAFHLY